MWYPAVVTAAPTNEPVTLSEVKKQSRAEYHEDDDAYLTLLIASGRDHVEQYCGRVFAERIVEVQATAWSDMCRLPVAPVDSVTITYIDQNGDAAIVPDADYELRGDGLVLATGRQWPAIEYGSLITVTAVVGADDAPPAVKHAIRLWVATHFEDRENGASTGRTAFDDLLVNYRR